jgi:phage shock protein PspC (stress-responsive transcriptional regulator)
MIHYLALFIGYTIIGIITIIAIFFLSVALYVIISEITENEQNA